jgi:molecular chaperone HscC
VTHPDDTVLSFKREMGTTRTFTLGGRVFTPQDLSALVLASLKHDAEEALGCKIEEAVVTVPAYFGDVQRQATRDSGAIAGLRVERIVNEPTAAALAYGLHHRDKELRVVVLDLGGGTFDVTVLEIIEGIIEVQSSAGDVRLGGDDFDEALHEHLARRIERELGARPAPTAEVRARLLEIARSVKHRLSTGVSTRAALADIALADGTRHSAELQVTREEAEAVWADLIDRLRIPITRALSDAGRSPSDIDEVLLVGGSTRMPCVARLAAEMFSRLPRSPLPPDEAVAMGAAVQAALKARNQAVGDMVVTDVAPFTMGIAVASQFASRRIAGVFEPILERGTVIPASRVKTFYTVAPGQELINVEVFQGERSLCKDNQFLGRLEVGGLRRAPAGEIAIDVRFTYDLNGILEVEATVAETGVKRVLVLEQAPGRLTREQIEVARKQMHGLKLHPREALPNTTALARADAVYANLVGEPREYLGRAIAAFRSAIETQDENTIRRVREELIALTRELR